MPRQKTRTASARRRKFPAAPPAFRDWATREEFQAENADTFPSPESLKWAIRCNRRELIEAGAIAEIGGRVHLHRQIFPETLLKIGKCRAARRVTDAEAVPAAVA